MLRARQTLLFGSILAAVYLSACESRGDESADDTVATRQPVTSSHVTPDSSIALLNQFLDSLERPRLRQLQADIEGRLPYTDTVPGSWGRVVGALVEGSGDDQISLLLFERSDGTVVGRPVMTRLTLNGSYIKLFRSTTAEPE